MKFSDLSSPQRSILTALCASNTLRTDQLANATNPRMDAQGVAQVLMQMREAGLVFSSQKPTGVQYASWRASDYGKAVFESRPHDVGPAPAKVVPAEPHAVREEPAHTFIVYKAGLIVGNGYTAQYHTEAEALAEAQRLTDAHKCRWHVAKLYAIVRPVVQPTNVIERV